ncbi:MAG: response regulator, partial [Pirellulales bacterium]|nr:response regulator [Pirellulales bacterium]
MAKHQVLIIEDDRSLSDVLSYNLEQAGYAVSVAHDGQDGLNQAQRKSPDVVILDLMLPVIDGLEVCRRLRANPTKGDVLVIMLTAKSEETDQVVGLAMGADDY